MQRDVQRIRLCRRQLRHGDVGASLIQHDSVDVRQGTCIRADAQGRGLLMGKPITDGMTDFFDAVLGADGAHERLRCLGRVFYGLRIALG